METSKLTEKSRAILEAIAEGHTYEQILVQDRTWTYHDIFRAAAEVLDIVSAHCGAKSYEDRIAEIRQAHPRAYEKWNAEEDVRLRQLFRLGATVKEIAHVFERQPSAIRSRLAKLSLFPAQSTGGTA